ncbi:exonuclease domain-containing protein [Aquibacillus sediminis]|uniref:exonuclease domain-containing protein n=1 Tax=Aquibacillus sediminis TaxID=2574734 RepID=UPI001107B880|nr:exonuclease domain-containing protein [Aquibacillus sediminis]
MVMNHMFQFVKQVSGKLNVGPYSGTSGQTDPNKVAYLRNLQRELKKKEVLEIPFHQLEVVVFDMETTGFFPYKGDKILSIGAVKVKGEQLLEEESFYSMIHHDSSLSTEIKGLTGLTNDQLNEAPPLQVVLREFYQFVKSDLLVAHHAGHEKQFMKHATWMSMKTGFQHRIVDTSFLMKVINPQTQLVTLDSCCDYYGITIEKRHHALHDAIATAKLWTECVRSIQGLGFENLKDVYTQLAKL